MQDAGAVIAAARPRVVAALAARLRDLDEAEDAFAEASASALVAWPKDPPRDPGAWLWRVALHKALDAKRRMAARSRAVLDPPAPGPTPEDDLLMSDEPITDERLRLIFVCCHPAIAAENRAALTLKVVCGLTTERLARAFLVAEPAMLQRITRAKRKIRDAGVPFEVPAREAWPERLEAVLATLEIAYAQAYEDAALAALVRFAEARRPARLDDSGAMVSPAEQDTGLWRGDLIAEGARLLDRAASLRATGPRQILAAIHGAHLSRRESGATPWAQIVALYDVLLRFRPDAVTAVNRAVAVGEAQGPEAGLGALEAVTDARLVGWLPYQAARAALCARAGRTAEAAEAYRAALALGPAPAERLFLEQRLAGLA